MKFCFTNSFLNTPRAEFLETENSDFLESKTFDMINIYKRRYLRKLSRTNIKRNIYICIAPEDLEKSISRSEKNVLEQHYIGLENFYFINQDGNLKSKFNIEENEIEKYILSNCQDKYVYCCNNNEILVYVKAQKLGTSLLYDERDVAVFEARTSTDNIMSFLKNEYFFLFSELKSSILISEKDGLKFEGSNCKMILKYGYEKIVLNHLMKYIEKYIGGTYRLINRDLISCIYTELNGTAYYFSVDALGALQQEQLEKVNLFEDVNIIIVDIRQCLQYIKENAEKNQQTEIDFLLIMDARNDPKPINKETLNYCPIEMKEYESRVNVIDSYKLANV